MPNFIDNIEIYLPDNIVDVLDLDKQKPHWHVNNSLKKTGVKKLHYSNPDESTLNIACKSATKVLDGINKDDYPDTIIVCTQTPDTILPHLSAKLQHELGFSMNTGCFDIALGCSGYPYGLSIAYAYLAAGLSKKILFVTAENYSKIIDEDNKTSRLLFSDGSSASILTKPEVAPTFLFGTDGSRSSAIECRNSGVSVVTGEKAQDSIAKPEFFMDGYGVFQFTIKTIPAEINKLIEQSGNTIDSIDKVFFHQGSKYILESLQKKLKIPDEKMFIDLEEVGNTASSSIPILMKRAEQRGELKRGDKVLLFGFGIGLSWSGAVFNY